jgi:VIT1/CCC1 family predicted Fe2+/Mn2+ transporter
VSAAGFVLGATPVVLAAVLPTGDTRLVAIAVVALLLLALVGVTAARLGGARPLRPVTRLVVIGGVALVVSAVVGDAVGAIL